MRIKIGTRIFLGMFAAVVTFLALAIFSIDWLVGIFLNGEAADELVRSIAAADRFQEIEGAYLAGKARSLAQTPHLRATLSIPDVDHETVAHMAGIMNQAAQMPLMLIVDHNGTELSQEPASNGEALDQPGIRQVLLGDGYNGIWEYEDDYYRVAAVPVVEGGSVTGAICVGYPLSTTVTELHHATGHDVAVVRQGEILTYCWEGTPPAGRDWGEAVTEPMRAILETAGSEVSHVRFRGVDYLAIAVSVNDGEATLILSRPLNQALAQFQRAKSLLLGAGAGILLLGLLVSRETASRISRPIRALTEVSQAYTRGNLSTRVEVRSKDELGTLAGSFNEMADKIEGRSKELSEARDKAEAALKAKSQFLANMSHELRTPLHGILSFSDFGIKKHAKVGPEKLLRYFEQIHQSGEGLLILLNDLLDLARLESGKMTFDFQRSDLPTAVYSVVDEFSSRAHAKGVELRWETDAKELSAVVDRVRITQVVRNLLSNAVRYSPESGIVDIRLELGNAKAVVAVKDQGPGIPEDELELVFDEFVQSTTTKTNAGGTGLGLAISREIISAHGGRIWARNNPEGGACFCFEIQLTALETELEVDGPGPPKSDESSSQIEWAV